jgi:hypothetical protein
VVLRVAISLFLHAIVSGGQVEPVFAQVCVGDCDGNGVVSVNENVFGLTMVLENLSMEACPSFDADSNGEITVDEVVMSVADTLYGCGIRPTRTPTPSPTRTPTATGTATPTSTPTPTQTPGLARTWVEDDFRLVSSTCPREIDDALRAEAVAVFPCEYQISVAGDRATSTDC